MTKEEFYALPKEERRTVMLKWRGEGLTFLQIGDLLGTSRSAVAGLCNRLGIKSKEPPEDKLKAAREAKQRKYNEVSNHSPDRIVKVVKKTIPIPVSHNVWDALPGTMPVRVMSVDKGQCRWPIGDRTHTVCGLPAEVGSPYCETHSKIAFKPIDKEHRHARS